MTGAVVCVIPARGGSKGIPGKNLISLAGKPLVAHSIEQALATPAIERVVVSTDDDSIAATAKEFGADVVARPADISGDEATSESALAHALATIESEQNIHVGLVVFLQPTSPLRDPSDIQGAIDLVAERNADAVFSAAPLHAYVWRRAKTGLESVTYDYRYRQRRQEREAEFIENGSIYVFKPWVLRDLGNRIGGHVETFVMDPLKSFQIDSLEDLHVMNRLWTVLRRDDTNHG